MALRITRYASDGILCDEWECPSCKNLENDIERVRESYHLLVKLLYSKEAINPHTLDNIINDMGAYLEADDCIPMHLPTVQPVGCLPEVLYLVNKEMV